MSRPYRDTAEKLRGDAPDRLDCWLKDGDRGKWIRAIYVKLALTLMACMFLRNTAFELAAIPLGLLGLFWAYRSWAERKGASVTFLVEHGRLFVRHDGDAFDVELDELHDVSLDTKSTKKNLTVARADGVNTIFGAPSQHNIELDVSRIELDFADEDRVVLGREWISSSLSTETLRSIRLFLRAHGWKPIDERG